mgnify:CR=1 FL=1
MEWVTYGHLFSMVDMQHFSTLGYWRPDSPPVFNAEHLTSVQSAFRSQAVVVQHPDQPVVGVATGSGRWTQSGEGYPTLAILPPIYPEWLGNRSFGERHGCRFPYVSGAMANGIATTELVEAIVGMGGMGFFGAAGLSVERVSEAINRLQSVLPNSLSWGSNLIHSPNEPHLEAAIAELYLERGVRRVSAAAYMKLSPYILRYALKGLRVDSQTGSIVRHNQVFAKVSRPEVAAHFMSPAPKQMVDDLVEKGLITPEEAHLAQFVSVAEDLIVESDSGGHTDNQALSALFPSIVQLRARTMAKHSLKRPIHLGAAGGLGDPQGVAAAFAMGADFVLTGSVNQGCVESGLDSSGKNLLAQVQLGDVTMAPAADMFELGVEVQVLKRGSLFAQRAHKLYSLYRQSDSLWAISSADRAVLEKNVLRQTVEEAWSTTEAYWQQRDPNEVRRALQDPKHQMALVFRSYLGLSSRWAIQGLSERKLDYQIWCGPAMAAFNTWVKGTFLEDPNNRYAAQVARNLLEGACQILRAQQLRNCGVAIPSSAFVTTPKFWKGQ